MGATAPAPPLPLPDLLQPPAPSPPPQSAAALCPAEATAPTSPRAAPAPAQPPPPPHTATPRLTHTRTREDQSTEVSVLESSGDAHHTNILYHGCVCRQNLVCHGNKMHRDAHGDVVLMLCAVSSRTSPKAQRPQASRTARSSNPPTHSTGDYWTPGHCLYYYTTLYTRARPIKDF